MSCSVASTAVEGIEDAVNYESEYRLAEVRVPVVYKCLVGIV